MLCATLATTAAYAATCAVVAGAGGDGSGTLTTLRILNDGAAKAIWNPILANAGASTNNPGKVCGAPWNGFNSYARFKKTSTGLFKSLNQSGFIVQFADGATLTRNGGDYFYTPAAGASGVKLLTGPVTILAVGSINGGSVDANDVAVGDTGTFDGYAGGQTDTNATNATGGTFDISVTIVPPPAISSVAPSGGPVAGGTSVTIAGTGFSASGNAVSFGGTAAAITAQSTNAITATAPAHAAGAASVVVTTSDSQTATAANGYTYVVAPTLASLAPATGSTAGGTVVTATGTNLSAVTALTVDGSPVTVSGNSATGFTFTTPAHAAGPIAVIATTAGGSATIAYTYADPPTLTTVAPAAGPLAGGNVVILTGSNFTATGTSVLFGATAATATFNSVTQLSVIAPSGSGTVNVTVTTLGGSVTKTAAYGYAAAPTVTLVAPASGPIAGNAVVTITGTGFIAGATVAIGGVAATGVTVVDALTITATSPAHAAGAVGVTVTTAGGTATLANGYTYVAVPAAPIVTAPANGAIVTTATPTVTGTAPANTTVTIFLNTVQAGQTAASGGGSWTFTTGTALPQGAATVYATATSAGGTSANSAITSFTIDSIAPAAPVITAPVNAATIGTTTPTITGTSEAGALITLTIDGGAGVTTSASGGGAWSYTTTALTRTAHTVSATAQDSACNVSVASSTTTFTVGTPPAVSSLSPVQGTAAGGTIVTIAGTNFTGATGVTFAGTSAGFTVVSDTLITATSPAGAAGAAIVKVTNAAGPGTVDGSYTYVAPPVAAAQAVAVPFNTATAITLGASNTPSGYAIATAPLHGVLSGAAPVLTYTPTTGYRGADSFTFTATNGGGPSAPATIGIVVADPILTLNGTPPAGTYGTSYNFAFATSGGTTPYSYAVTSGILPSGLALASDGTLSGTPAGSGSFPVTVTVTDSTPGSPSITASRAVTLIIAAPALALTPATLPGAAVGAVYGQALVASGGTAPYSYAVSAGALPVGVTLSASGVLAGTPSAGGSFAFTVTATDATAAGSGGPYTVSAAYTLAVAVPSVTLAPPTLPAGTSGVAYSQALAATGGTAPYSYAVTAGALPAGLSLSPAGVLAGTPTASGSASVSITATDSSTGSGPYATTRSYTLVVAAPALTLTPATLPGAAVGAVYGQALVASGGTAPYSYAVTAGALPAGVTLSAGGVLAGTPIAGGSFAFTVTATDATAAGSGGPYSVSAAYTLAVAVPSVTLAPATLPAGTSGIAYSQALAATGGTAPYAYAVTAGALPAGLTLSPAGVLAGTPTASGSASVSITATDSSTGSGPYATTRSYTLVVAAPALALTPATLPGAAVGAVYGQALVASGGTAPYGYAVTAGALPAGVTLSASGVLAGTPTAGGSFAFTVTTTDATAAGSGGPYTVSAAYTLTVAVPSIALAPATLPAGTSGVAYSQALAATGGTAPYSFAVTAGALPAGLTLSPAGVLAGTPTASGSASMSITATDSSTGSGPYATTRSYTLVVAAPALALTPATLPGAAVGAVYGQALVASGGTAPYGYAVTAGALPAGVTLSASGVLAGTPTAGGSFAFTVTTTDATAAGSGGPYTVSAAYTLTVAVPSIALAPATLPAGTSGVAYSQALAATGGTAPYSFAVTAGALPAGLTLSPAGVLAGTPTASGSASMSITATDSSTGSGPYATTRSYTLVVALPPPPVATDAPSHSIPASTATTPQSSITDLSSLVTGSVTDIQIATQPQHGTVTVASSSTATGTRFLATYTPVAGFSGDDGFTYAAVGPGGRSATARVAFTVVGAVPIAGAVRGETLSGQAVIIDLTAGATNGPFTAAQIVTVSPVDAVTLELIEGGTAASRLYQLRVTPGGRFSGTATIRYTISNAFGASAPAVVTINVTARPDPSQDPDVRAISAAQAEAIRRFASAQTDNFMRRTEQLHGDAAASQRSPFGITMSGLANGLGGNGLGGRGGYGGVRSGAAPPDFPAESDVAMLKMGHATAVADAERAAGLISFERSDATTPLESVMGRGRYVTSTPNGARMARDADRSHPGSGSRSGSSSSPGSDASVNPRIGDTVAGEDAGRKIGSLALWSGGAVSVGTRDQTNRRAKLSVTTAGLSAGADIKLAEGITLGAGGGYGADRTRIGGDTGQVDGDSWVGVAYGSIAPVDGLFVDGVFGAGRLAFDTRRTIAANGAVARGHREGSMLFGSLATGFDRTTDRWSLSAYGRADILSADLDGYAENAGGLYELAFDKRDVTSLTGVLGLRGAIAVGAFTPRVRVEWRHEFRNGGVQALDYTGLPGFGYRIDGDQWLRDAFRIDFGNDIRFGNGWRFGTEIGGAFGQGAASATGRVTLGMQF